MLKSVVLVAVIALAYSAAFCQSPDATVAGRVVDTSTAVIAGAKVEVISLATGVHRTSETNREGSFVIPNLAPGPYRIEVAKNGFKTVVREDVVLHVQDIIALNFTLPIGSTTESVTVKGGAPLVNTQDATVGTVIDRNFVANLPLNGRDIQSLILLTPGVTITPQTAADPGTFSVNGQRASTNAFLVDGVSANISAGTVANPTYFGNGEANAIGGAYAGTNAFGATNGLVSVDALEEFKIQTSTYTADSGRQPGGQISLVTRSGTNAFHGSLFEYLRNDLFDARDYFNPEPARKPALRQNLFGGTFSGPIFKNKTFFFFSYEGQRLRLPVSDTVDVPSLRLRDEAAPAVRAALNANPLPTGPELQVACTPGSDPTCPTSGMKPSGFAPYAFSYSNPSSMDATSLRIDHTVNSKITLFGRFNDSPSSATTFYGTSAGFTNVASTLTATLGANWLITPRLTDEVRFNYSRQAGDQKIIPATYGGAVPVDPSSFISGSGNGQVDFFLNGYLGQAAGGSFVANAQHQFNLVDSVSFVTGPHQLKFGIDYRRLSPIFGVQNNQSDYFVQESSMVSGIADFVSIGANLPANPIFTNVSAYAQDAWTVNSRLTLDLGLRWEINPAPSVSSASMPAVVLGITGNPPNYSNATLAPTGTSFYKTFYTAFAPRIGAAYRLIQNQRHETVVRGGFGIYYDLGSDTATNALPIGAFKSLVSVPFPLSAANAAPPVPEVPKSLPITDGTIVYASTANVSLPYTMQWNAAVEQSLGSQQSVSVSYVGSAARRLLTTQDLNYPSSFALPPPNPNFGPIVLSWNGPTSDYQSLQSQYKAHLGDRLQALISYTWSHAIDDVSTDKAQGTLIRGNADFDIRHIFSAALTYNIPSPSRSFFLTRVIENWSTDAIIHAQSGRPIDLVTTIGYIGGENVNVRPDVVPGQPYYIDDPSVPGGRRFNSAAFTSPPTDPTTGLALRQGDFGRNVLRELPLYQADFGVGRMFSLTDRFKLKFKAEVFNLFNHPSFGNYQLNYLDPSTFGVPTQTMANSLGGLSPLYQLGGPRSMQFSLRLSF